MFQTDLAAGEIIEVRSEYLPIISLDTVFGSCNARHASSDEDEGLFVTNDTNGRLAAIRVYELLGQHQLVISSLEANCKRVRSVSGANIMGDGPVSLILDTAHLLSISDPEFARAA